MEGEGGAEGAGEAMEVDHEGTDEVMEEFDLFVSKAAAEDQKQYLLQYPLKRKDAPLQLEPTREGLTANYKQKSEKLEIKIPLNTGSSVFDRSKAKHMAQLGKAEQSDEIIKATTMRGSILRSHTAKSFAVGFVKNGQFHLTALDGVLQMRHNFNYLNAGSSQAAPTAGEKTESESESEGAQTIRVKFAKEAGAKKKKGHRKFGEEVEDPEDPWLPLIFSQAEGPLFGRRKEALESKKSDPVLFPAAERNEQERMRLFVPEGFQETTGKSALPSNMVSLTDLRSKPLTDQVVALMENGKVMSFHQLWNLICFQGKSDEVVKATIIETLKKYAMLVQGHWVIKSEYLYKEGSFSEKTGAPGATLANARDFIMYRLHGGHSVKRKEVIEAVNVDGEDVLELLKSLARFRRYKGWTFKYSPDEEFIAKNPSVVSGEAEKWRIRWNLLQEKLTAQALSDAKRARSRSGGRRRTQSGRTLSSSSDREFSPGGSRSRHASGSAPRRRRVSVKAEPSENGLSSGLCAPGGNAIESQRVSLAASSAVVSEVVNSIANSKKEQMDDGLKRELRTFAYQRLCEDPAQKVGGLMRKLGLKQSEVEASHPLHGLKATEQDLIEAAEAVGAVLITPKGLAKSEWALLFGQRGSHQELRAFLIEYIRGRNGFRLGTFKKAASVTLPDMPADNVIRDLIQEYCVCKAGVFSLKTLSE